MVSLTFLRICHFVAMTAAGAVLAILAVHYGKALFSKAKVMEKNESR